MNARLSGVLVSVALFALGLALGAAARADSEVGAGDDSVAAAVEALRAGRTLEAAERLLARLPGDRDAAILLGRIVLSADLAGSYRVPARRALESAVARSDDDRLAAFYLAELLTSGDAADRDAETASDLYRRAADLGLTEALGRLLQPALLDALNGSERAEILDRALQRSARAEGGLTLPDPTLAGFAADEAPTGRWQVVAFAAHAGHRFWRAGPRDQAAAFNRTIRFDDGSTAIGDHLCRRATFVGGLPATDDLVAGTVGLSAPISLGDIGPNARVLHLVCAGRAIVPIVLTGADEILLPVDGGILVLWPRPDGRIADVQRLLTAEGYPAGRADGYYGPVTRQAVMERERDLGQPSVGNARGVLPHAADPG